MAKWIKTNFPGVRYREHLTRKNGVRKDQYFTIRYKVTGKDREEGLGWASEGWTASKAYDCMKELKENRKFGVGPQTLDEKRKIEDARKAMEKAEAERLEKEAVTFGSFFKNNYLPQAIADKKERTAVREEGIFKKWISPAFGHLPIKDIAKFHLQKLKKVMEEGGQSPRSIVYALAVVRQVFNAARREGIYEKDSPTKDVKKPKVDNGRMRFFTHKEAEMLLAVLQEKSPDVHDLTLLSLHAGLRFGEIASLKWQDVDLNRGVLTIRDSKAGSRYAFLTEQAAEMFQNRPQGRPSDYVFQKRGGGKMEKISHSFFRTVDELKFNEGIEDSRLKICYHSCRHSFASWMIEQGQDLYTVQKLLGHKTNVMTQRYAHMVENKLKDAIRSLGQALRPQKEDTGQDKAGQVLNFTK
jgi:integrase